MIRVRQLLLLAILSCGRQSPQFRVQLPSSVTNAEGESPTVEMRAGETLSIAFVLVGNVPDHVTFSATGLPSFATLSGAVLTLAPTRRDQGEFTFTVAASAGSESASTSVRLVVSLSNTAPTWNGQVWPYLVEDDKGFHHAMICPGPHCTIVGTMKVHLNVCDDDGDGINLDVEVVPRGQAFSGQATYSGSLPRLSGPSNNPYKPTQNCGQLSVALPGLSPDQSYEFTLRISDEFGATAVYSTWADDHGWMHPPSHMPWYFDQGPCTTRTCGCVPAGLPCEANYQCCSGASDPYGGPFWGFFSGTCK